MAWKYPFLYDFGRNNEELIKECVEASIATNYFLHFAGSWYESQMWRINNVLRSEKQLEKFRNFAKYKKVKVTGKPKGQIKPKIV